ncbi:MAG: 2-hydroxyglutaryl-CoA dehydratase [Desulfovibrionaceae bacterium]|nr:2-hydroxyglutaryl-CoA dehydratase [Desulfovibrionaceae bacterium]
MQQKIFAGIDAGSAATKVVLLESEHLAVVARATLPTGWNPRESAENVLQMALKDAGCLRANVIVATGYGRVAFPFADKNITEISCHAKGAAHLFPNVGLVIDIGGQDSKVIRVQNSMVSDFVMNDKCAAGTGRFVQTVAGILGVEIGDMCACAAEQKPCAITSMCAVFAETEIIGLLAQGTDKAAIAAGVLQSIARRIHALAARFPMPQTCVFTGGLARSSVCATILSNELGVPVFVPEYPQYIGALGAALLAANLK